MSKTISFGIMHVGVAFLVVWMMTGDMIIGGAVAMVEPMVNTIAYHFHEKVWARRKAVGIRCSVMPA
ncbi:DUF2061 domain-containing protein [Alcanivorax sp. 1008]|uniref:DUF2061 domain-containing protein n=1 Tax=Alcanivorax sp. 1008 TaxID=2816853 RepID=UPI001DA862DD|nr:DUF2061 domain-containing protein [Alcanivorax sp. 1008]MCC1495191.1 DUF2061 domain-containing protein [Alcanivorax sp. 1008]